MSYNKTRIEPDKKFPLPGQEEGKARRLAAAAQKQQNKNDKRKKNANSKS
jgi:hypothetical protein